MKKFESHTYMIKNGVNKTIKGEQLINSSNHVSVDPWPFTEISVMRK